MDRIPINFDHEGKKYNCYFHQVAGAGETSVWHLMDDQNYYLGRLRHHNDQWIFDPTPDTKTLSILADFFGDVVTSWYQ